MVTIKSIEVSGESQMVKENVINNLLALGYVILKIEHDTNSNKTNIICAFVC